MKKEISIGTVDYPKKFDARSYAARALDSGMMNKIYSFTAASSVPLKICINQDLLDSIIHHKYIPPYHIQLNPTAKCNQDCSWCSCSNRDRTKELSYEEIMGVFNLGKSYGTKATTLTGDGDPLCHPRINDVITDIKKLGIDVGVVNNGWFVKQLTQEALDCITWMRISLGDGQTKKPKSWWESLIKVVESSSIDFSFSYVLTDKPQMKLIERMIRFANEYRFVHIRVVNNIFVADKLFYTMENAKRALEKKIDTSLVIWQSRSEWKHGTKDCYISLLKPVLASNGFWYSCCGNQYMTEKPERRYVFPMSKYRCSKGLKDIVEHQKCFDGSSVCVKCYYSNYNELLDVLLNGLNHANFV